MSNWSGVGTPENGQILFCKNTSENAAFIGECVSGTQWAVELERTGKIVSCPPGWFGAIKTPEQVEEEKAIDKLAWLIQKSTKGYCFKYSKEIAIALHKAGYHNQTRLKPMEITKFLDMVKMAENDGVRQAYYQAVMLGYIIEAKGGIE